MVSNCPHCSKPVAPAYKPFCSKRCADIDLGAWLKGGYAIPGSPINPENAMENDPDEA